jgi:hypothetical protein
MLRAIQLDDQLFIRTGKVNDVACDRHLPPKGKAHQPMRPDFVPELQFGICHLLAHLARIATIDGGYPMMSHREAPLSALPGISPLEGGDLQRWRLAKA